MKEYIDRNAVVAQITKLINESGKYTDYECGADDACFVVTHAPAADVRPVVHAKWREGVYAGYRCPVCVTTWDSPTNFCPNCGTDMREKS